MAKKDRTLDKTHLSIDQAEERGFIHRDYIAHCLRWSHVVKFLYQGNKYKTARILDIGCGKEMPLAKLLHSSRLAPTEGYYLGVDANKLTLPEQFKNSKWKPDFIGQYEFPKFALLDNYRVRHAGLDNSFITPNVLTCFEVAEHVEPSGCRLLIEGIKSVLHPDGTAFLSTPVWDPEVGAADNHINEMTYQAMGALLEDLGFVIEGHWGTFASQKDYKHWIGRDVIDGEVVISTKLWEALSQYYDSNYLATVFAPLFPHLSRNVLWRVKHHTGQLFRQFPKLAEVPGPWTSSPKWEELNG